MILSISHSTRYTFDLPVSYGVQQLRQTPKSYRAQSVLAWTTRLKGANKQLEFDDFHRNRVELISISDGAQELIIESEGRVEMADTHGIVGPHAGPAPLWLFLRGTPMTQSGRGTRAIVSQVPDGEPLERLHALSGLIKDQVAYEVGASAPDWTAEEAVAAGKGVCQDHTHIFLTCARIMGFPARYADVPGVGRDIAVVTTGLKIDGEAPCVEDPPPRLGQHADEIWSELGCTADEIAALREERAI